MTIGIVTIRERNQRTSRMEDVVDYAFNINTNRTVILPCETPQSLGAKWDENMGLWLLEDSTPFHDPRSADFRKAA